MAVEWSAAELGTVQARLLAVCRELPETEVQEANGHTGFFTRRTRFAWLLVDHHGDGRLALWVRAPRGEQAALVGADPERYFVPPYLGPSGWVGALLNDASDPDWAEITGLLEQAWRLGATKRAIAALDTARTGTPGITGTA